jgi:hypothetical protein
MISSQVASQNQSRVGSALNLASPAIISQETTLKANAEDHSVPLGQDQVMNKLVSKIAQIYEHGMLKAKKSNEQSPKSLIEKMFKNTSDKDENIATLKELLSQELQKKYEKVYNKL